MQFGTSTWIFQEDSICEALEHILECGFHVAEIWMEHLWKTGESPEEIARHARHLQMELSLHSASYDVNITSLNPGIRKESLRQLEESIITGRRLGAKRIAVHPGYLSSRKVHVHTYWTQMEETFTLINQWAQREGLIVGVEAMENLPRHEYTVPDHLRRVLAKGWTNIGVTFDIAHAFSHMDPVDFLHQLDPQWIVHVHLSDSSPKATHLPLGKGEVDLQAILRELDNVYNGFVIIEGAVPSQGKEITHSNKAYLQQLGWQ